jgi:hypothetical protein
VIVTGWEPAAALGLTLVGEIEKLVQVGSELPA